jgi:hypothetical protein
MQTQTNQELKTFTGWLKLHPTTEDEELNKWMDKVSLICKRYFEYYPSQPRKRQSIEFKFAIIGAINFKFPSGTITLKKIGSQIARSTNSKAPLSHSTIIYLNRKIINELDPKFGEESFINKYAEFKSELEKLGLL